MIPSFPSGAAMDAAVLQWLGTAGENQPIYGGTLMFGVVGLGLFYFAFVSKEMESGPVLKGLSIGLLVLAVLAAFWPSRPWPH